MFEKDNFTVKIDAFDAMETLGQSLTDEANKMLENGENEDVARRLHTVGRNMIERGREQESQEPSPEDFQHSLYDM